ncbi:MAG: hypothetical protein ACLFSQ_12885, partial [Candidatus Zixiibacteriota bacterium]
MNIKNYEIPKYLEFFSIIIFAFVIYAFYNPAVFAPNEYIITHKIDCGDKYVHLWNYYIADKIFEGDRLFHTDMILYPTGTSLVYHSATFLHGFIYSIFNLFRINDIILFSNLLHLLISILTFLGGYLIGKLKKLGFVASFLIGFIFTFSYARFHSLAGHWNIYSTEFMPFAIIGLILIDKGKNWGYILYGIMMALTLWVSMQLCAILAIIIGFYLIYRLIERKLVKSEIRWILFSFLIFIIFSGPLIFGYLEAIQEDGIGPNYDVSMHERYSSDPIALIIPHDGHFITGAKSDFSPFKFTSSKSYIGIAILFLLVAALINRKKIKMEPFWLYLAIFFWIMSLGPSIMGLRILPERFLMYLPPFSLFRTPYRYAFPMIFSLAIFISPLVGKFRNLAFILIPILIIDFFPGNFKLEKLNHQNQLKKIMNEDGSVINIPFGIRDGLREYCLYSIKSQYLQIYHEKPIIGGYIARLSPVSILNQLSLPIVKPLVINCREREKPSFQFNHTQKLKFIEKTGLKYVIIHKYI